MARVEPYINHPNPSLRLPSGQMCPIANVPASSASICQNIALYSTIQDWVEEVGYVSEGEHSFSDAPSHATAPAPVPEAAVSDATGRVAGDRAFDRYLKALDSSIDRIYPTYDC